MKKFNAQLLSDFSPIDAYNLMEQKSVTSELQATQTIIQLKKLKACGNQLLCSLIEKEEKI